MNGTTNGNKIKKWSYPDIMKNINMKLLLPLFFAFFFLQCASNNFNDFFKTYNTEEYSYWTGKNDLSWAEFEGIPNDTSADVASHIQVYNPAIIEMKNAFSNATLAAICLFDKKKSWVIKAEASEYQLLYDQVIFNIYELYTRKLRMTFSKTNFSIEDYKNKFQTITKENNQQLIKTINQVRKDTFSGQIGEATKLWYDKISDELDSLKDYSENKY